MSVFQKFYDSSVSNLNLGLTLAAALMVHEAVKYLIRTYIGDGNRTAMTYVFAAGAAILLAVVVQHLTLFIGMKLASSNIKITKKNQNQNNSGNNSGNNMNAGNHMNANMGSNMNANMGAGMNTGYGSNMGAGTLY